MRLKCFNNFKMFTILSEFETYTYTKKLILAFFSDLKVF